MPRHLAPLFVLALVSFGCGKVDPIDQTHQGSIDDGDSVMESDDSLYDEYPVRVGEGMKVIVSMDSTALDPYLLLVDAQNNTLAEHDDISPDNTNARLEYVATQAGTLRVIANTFKGHTGAYTLRIQTQAAE